MHSQSLNVEAVANLWLLRAVDVFHDVPGFVGALQGDGEPSIELDVIPVHLGQAEDFLAHVFQLRIAVEGLDAQGAWDVDSRVGFVEIHDSFCVEHTLSSRRAQQCPSGGR